MEVFTEDKIVIGLILGSYTIMALLVRPFAGFIVDKYPRKLVLLIFFVIFITYFLGYIFASTLLLFAFIRATHGMLFGLVTVSSSTMAIDVIPSQRRGEGVGYYGVSTNLAMALGPVLSLYIFDTFHNYNFIFFLAFLLGIVGLILIIFIKAPQKQILEVAPVVSLDRFILTKGIPAMLTLTLIGVFYGMVCNFVAIFAIEEVGISSGAGLFFITLALGITIARLFSGKALNSGKLKELIVIAIIALIASISIFVTIKSAAVFYISSFVIGIGYGLLSPCFQTLILNLSHHNQRGTANATYFTGWDLGIGIGAFLGGVIADVSSYATSFSFGLGLIVIALIIYLLIVNPHYIKNKI